ncbi:hypothetical protein E4T38_03326 [Aureobasidium subglaciale]|nr:hypothetical protein E4T38_03326 [Aureobasidium subglaciale]KAI5226556.1 hypothetical protein E4T40_03100 [Aureobasidium subglaciale]KAI5229883.1 hypothetical protein E4T41_03323 [Aureobasidium subglaciale]KAI5264434.1 hypothetical protein E4T46_03101 [Aureobasidium subglaciale]
MTIEPARDIDSFFAQHWVKHGEAEVLFIKRAARKGDRWTSHVALPGGRRDPEDESDQKTAVREAVEEVGMAMQRLWNFVDPPELQPPPQQQPLILWGLTLGVVADLLDLLPPHNALELWSYPTFTMPDVRLIIWLSTYKFRKSKRLQLEAGNLSMPPLVKEGLDAISPPEGERNDDVGMGGLGSGRSLKGRSFESAVGTMLEGYYACMRKVSQHRSADSCWVILYGNVYDVTKFVPEHPGGAKIILQLAGQDATEEYDPIHPPGILEESLAPECKLGPLDASTLPAVEKPKGEEKKEDEDAIMPLDHCLNMDDIEAVATKKMSKKAWAYYFSAADDLRSKALNNTVYSDILLRPRVFVDITKCDTSSTILGNKVNIPLFVSPAAMARLGHPDGEHGIARACSTFGACQIISNNASQTPEQILEGSPPDQVFGWQLYVQRDRKKSEEMLVRINRLTKIKFIVLTLDAPVPGKREHDEREGKNVGSNLPIRSSHQEGSSSTTSPDPKAASGSVASAMFAGTAGDLTWKTTLPWLAKHTKLPIVLKGLQTHEDAYLASLYAPQVQGIILSNHGGRAADTAPPAIHTLIEIRKYCPEVLDKIEVWVDGGIKRGTDVVKALCLGAKAVGMGRNALYGLGAGGIAGVERVYEILKAEIETTMRLLAVEKIEDLGPQHINARAVERDIYDGPAGLEKLSMWIKAKL